MQTHKPVGFEMTAVVQEFTEMPSAYKDVHIQHITVDLQLCVRQEIPLVGNKHELAHQRKKVNPSKNKDYDHIQLPWTF